MEKSWSLIGMMGVGKSTVGRALAELSGREFLDTDQMIQNRLGRSIPKIFEFYGEQTFRQHEASIIQSLQPGPFVISTGGGAILNEESWQHLNTIGWTIYLKADPQVLKLRLEKSNRTRPLLASSDWETKFDQIYTDRQPLYHRASIVVQLDDCEIHDVAQKVLDAVTKFESENSFNSASTEVKS